MGCGVFIFMDSYRQGVEYTCSRVLQIGRNLQELKYHCTCSVQITMHRCCLIFLAYTLNILWMCNWSSSASGGGVILHHLWANRIFVHMPACGLEQQQDVCGPEKTQSYHRVYSVVKHSVSGQTQFPIFCSAITQPFPFLPASSSIQDRGLGQW